jgi:plastocyanin
VGDIGQCEGQPVPCVGFFSPLNLTISVGDTVRWTNHGNIAHTATSGVGGSYPGAPDGLWDSGILGLGQAFSHTFSDPGSFTVFCVLHPDLMGTATIRVED